MCSLVSKPAAVLYWLSNPLALTVWVCDSPYGGGVLRSRETDCKWSYLQALRTKEASCKRGLLLRKCCSITNYDGGVHKMQTVKRFRLL